MKPPRGLSADEAAAWASLAATVRPLVGKPKATASTSTDAGPISPPRRGGVGGRGSHASVRSAPPPNPSPNGGGFSSSGTAGLDSTWEKKLARGTLAPDFTLDLHGLTLAGAHDRLDHGLAQAIALGARVVLLITGKSRPVDAADRGERRGAIRAKVLDWLAVGPHGSDIAAIRKAHRRHGGEGALYLVLRRKL